MYRHKEVGLGLVGNLCPAPQLHEDVFLTRIDNADVRTVTFNDGTEGQRIAQRQVFLLRDAAHGSGIVPSMSGINDQHKLLVVGSVRPQHTAKHPEKENNLFAHFFIYHS